MSSVAKRRRADRNLKCPPPTGTLGFFLPSSHHDVCVCGAAKDKHKDEGMAVERVDRSPMNKLQWCVALQCGHEAWVTRKARPTAKRMRCEECVW